MVLCWAIWGSRNDDVKNNGKNTLIRTSTFTLQYFKEFKLVQQHEEMSIVEMIRKWERPKHGHVKISFEEATSEADGIGGAEVIIRDGEGFVLAACSISHLGAHNPEIMEALVALNALVFAKDMGVQRFIVEDDAV
ncbi:hypothetical protein REPUB_Repub11eG0048400 [Reevesia pubescens]